MDDDAHEALLSIPFASIAPPPLPLEYSRIAVFGRPWWLILLGYFGFVVAIYLVMSQGIHVIEALDLQPRAVSGAASARRQIPNVIAPNSMGVVFQQNAANGLFRWQILTLIALSLLGICVAIMLFVGTIRIIGRKPGARKWMRRYAVWQIATVIPTALACIGFAEGIAWYDDGIVTEQAVSNVRALASIQALMAVVWSLLILSFISRPRAIQYWRSIDAPDDLPESRIPVEPLPT